MGKTKFYCLIYNKMGIKHLFRCSLNKKDDNYKQNSAIKSVHNKRFLM